MSNLIITDKKPNNLKKIIIIAIILTLALTVFLVTFSIINGKKIKSISVKSLPHKVEYYVGESFDNSGLIINVTLNNGRSYEVLGKDVSVIDYINDSANDCLTVKVCYQDKCAYFDVKIKEKPTFFPDLTQLSIKALPNKLEYKIGESISLDGGLLTCVYSDSTSINIPMLKEYVSGFSTSTVGQKVITITYSENSVTLSTSFVITVTE